MDGCEEQAERTERLAQDVAGATIGDGANIDRAEREMSKRRRESMSKDQWSSDEGKSDNSKIDVSKSSSLGAEQSRVEATKYGAKEEASEVGQRVEVGVKDAARAVREIGSQANDAASKAASAAKEGAKSAVAELKDGVVEIRTTASEAGSSAKERVREVASELGKGTSEVARRTKHVAEDLSEAAVDAAIVAKEEVVEVVNEASQRAKTALRELAPILRRASKATGTFASNNAVPLSMMGFGAGWLLVRALRGSPLPHGRSETTLAQQEREGVGDATQRTLRGVQQTRNKLGGLAHDAGERAQKVAHDAGERAQKVAHEAGARAQKVAHDAGELVTELKDRTVHQVDHARDTLTRQATKLSKEAQAQFISVKDATADFAHEHPLAMIALSVGVGVGTSLLLPPSQSENRLLGPQRERLLEKARDTATRVADVQPRSASDNRYPH